MLRKPLFWYGHNIAQSLSYRVCGQVWMLCEGKVAHEPDSVTTVMSGGMGLNSNKPSWESCGRRPKIFNKMCTGQNQFLPKTEKMHVRF